MQCKVAEKKDNNIQESEQRLKKAQSILAIIQQSNMHMHNAYCYNGNLIGEPMFATGTTDFPSQFLPNLMQEENQEGALVSPGKKLLNNVCSYLKHLNVTTNTALI